MTLKTTAARKVVVIAVVVTVRESVLGAIKTSENKGDSPANQKRDQQMIAPDSPETDLPGVLGTDGPFLPVISPVLSLSLSFPSDVNTDDRFSCRNRGHSHFNIHTIFFLVIHS